MRTMVSNYYDLMTFGLGGASFQQFVDRFQEKYNVLQADGFHGTRRFNLITHMSS